MVIFRLYAPIEASNFPKVKEGRRLAYPTTGSLVLRAKDRLRLFRFPLTRDTLPLSASVPIRVNSTGRILTLWLIRLRGTIHPALKSEASVLLGSCFHLFSHISFVPISRSFVFLIFFVTIPD